MSRHSPFDPFVNWVHMAQMFVEAQTVISLRMLGLAGVWSVAPTETVRMIAEKPAAFTRSAHAATSALMSGKTPYQVAAAAIYPIRRQTRANSRRLKKSGPRKF